MQLLEREIDQLMTQHAWQQQPMLLKLHQIKARRMALQQQQSIAQAITLEKHSGMFSRKPHYDLPESFTDEQLTLMLQKPLMLHDMQVTHLVIARDALNQWLQKGARFAASSMELALRRVWIYRWMRSTAWLSVMSACNRRV